jgi:hypothetical protein
VLLFFVIRLHSSHGKFILCLVSFENKPFRAPSLTQMNCIFSLLYKLRGQHSPFLCDKNTIYLVPYPGLFCFSHSAFVPRMKHFYLPFLRHCYLQAWCHLEVHCQSVLQVIFSCGGFLQACLWHSQQQTEK